MYVLAHASTLIKPGHIWVRSRSARIIIRVSDADPVAMLVPTIRPAHACDRLFKKYVSV